MFHPNTDVKGNFKILTISELRSILHVLSDYVALLSILFLKKYYQLRQSLNFICQSKREKREPNFMSLQASKYCMAH